MKKIMLSSVILLPLIILLILTIGTVVVGVTNHIYVETVSFREVDTLVLVKDSVSSVPSAKPEVNVFPLTASNAEIVYSSYDENIVKIDADGTVHGIDFGETRIRAESKENPTISAERVVLVTDTKAHRVEIENAPARIYEGQRVQLRANVFPKEAEDKSIRWSSSDPSVLEVSSDGTLTFRKVGTAVVTVSCVSDPTVSASVEIECKRPVSSIDTGGITSVTTATVKAQFPAIRFTPVDAKETITYTVSDKEIASVSETGEITFKKAGKTYVIATVTDGLENTASAKVSYEYTDGKYQNIWFERGGEKVDTFSIDFDEYSGKKDIGLSICGTPLDASVEVKITYSAEDKIEYRDDGKFYVLGTGDVIITATAQTYTGKTITASCTVHITRKISSIRFPGAEENSVSVTEPTFDIWTVMEVQPSGGNDGYTETLCFTLSDAAIASVSAYGRVQFNKEGTVYISAESESGVKNSLKITYVYVPIGEKKIEIWDSTPSDSLFDLALNSMEAQSGTLVVAPPAGYDGELSIEIVEGDSVALEGNRVTAKHGGFTTLRISAVASSTFRASADIWSKEIVLYVDETVQNMSFNYSDNYKLSGTEVGLALRVSNVTALEGKIVRYRLKSASSVASVDSVTGQLKFSGAGTATIIAEIFYDEEKLAGMDYDFSMVVDKKEIIVTSLCGNLDKFVLRHNDNDVESEELFTMNAGETLTFVIDKDRFSPSDFVLTENKFSVYTESDALQWEFDVETGEITLKGVAGTFTERGKAGPAYIDITVGGKTLRIRVAVNAYADSIFVQTNIPSQDASVRDILSDKEYVTLSNSLTLQIIIGRKDGLTITDRTIQWKCGELSGSLDLGISDTLRIDNLPLGSSEIRLETAGGVDFLFTLVRRESLEDFGIAFRYMKNIAGEDQQYTAALVESATVAQSMPAITVALPENAKDFFAYVLLPQNYLGEWGEEEFKTAFPFNASTGIFTLSYEEEIAMVGFSVAADKTVFRESVQLSHGNLQLDFLISRSDLKSISFGDSTVSFDMNDKAMDGAVYKGLQQARLFAKHSYYNGASVDYYKLPLTLNGSIETVQWTFTPYVGNVAGEARTLQIGNTINSGGKQYTIGQDEIPAGVSWVDIRPYAQEKCVYVYFGDFDGLSEKDVQTDNFGNFDGKDDYTPVDAQDPGTFLQLTASDGTANGVNTYYNFNVLNDLGSTKVVNIFDANGFYNNSAFILHTNLYSPTDKPSADTSANIILSDGSKNYGKSFIYGNGYQVNYQSKSENGQWSGGSEQKSDIGVGRAYNATLKGKDAKISDGSKRHAVFTGTYFKYCKIMACYKGLWVGGSTCYVENCVYQYMDDMAIQISSKESKLYLKNIVVIDSNKGLENQKEAFYVNGFIDSFNYKAEENLSGLGISSSAADKILNEAEPYVELLNGKPFFNLIMAFSKSGASKRPLYLWDGSAIDNETGWNMSDHVHLKRVYGTEGFLGLGAVGVWTYIYAENMPENAYRISLQCQGKEWDSSKECLVENTNHLAWHMNRCYRNQSLAGWNIEDHAEHLAQSLA